MTKLSVTEMRQHVLARKLVTDTVLVVIMAVTACRTGSHSERTLTSVEHVAPAWLRRRKNGDATMKPVWFAVAFGAALLLSASTVAVNAMGGGSCHLPKTCAVDLNSLCASVPVGDGRLPACEGAHGQSFGALLRQAFEGSLCGHDMRSGRQAFLRQRHIRRRPHRVVHADASRRSQQLMQERAGVHRRAAQHLSVAAGAGSRSLRRTVQGRCPHA